jgi:hypothetical protein
MFEAQSGLCGVCRRALGDGLAVHVDHCHATGHVRGLLCSNCNLAAGAVKDSPETATALAAYLTRWRP